MSGVSTSASTESPGPPQVVTLNQNQESKTQVCKYFIKNQSCHFGNKCRFLHPQESCPVYVQRSFPVEDAAVSEESVFSRTSRPKVYLPPHRLRQRAHHEAVNRPRTDEDTLPINQNTFGQVCKFYSRNGFCKFGDNCKYVHEQDDGDEEYSTETDVREHTNYGTRRGGRGGRGRGNRRAQKDQNTYTPAGPESEQSSKGSGKQLVRAGKSNNQKPKKLCRYFKNGDCRQGDNCKFWHPYELPEISNNDTDEIEELTDDSVLLKGQVKERKDAASTSKQQREIVQPSAEFSIETLTDEEVAKHRITEINTLMKRFPRAHETSLPRRQEGAYKITFVPSDPDWVRFGSDTQNYHG